MLQIPLRNNAARKLVSQGKTIPAPVGGWDASSPLENMKPDRAIALENWFPEQAYCRIRRGHSEHAQMFDEESPGDTQVDLIEETGTVETLMAYHGLSANKLFAVAGGALNDVTANDDGVFVDTGYTNSRFQHINFTTSGGKFLYAVNGADAPIAYDGSSWSEPSITGISEEDAIHICAHKRRIWFTMDGSTKAAYLPVDSIAGAATEFDFGALFTKGGVLQAIGTWTVDSGTGPDDMLVAMSSRGQAAIYQGTNPASADTWSLVGVFDLGAPIGRRCLTKVGGDLALISIDGVVPLSKAISLDRGASQIVAITANIQKAMNDAAVLHKDKFGWQLIGYPKGTAAFLNVPVTANLSAMQFVMNTLSGAWCKYTGMNAFCWEIMDDRIFFGGLNGLVYEADIGSTDDDMAISTVLKPAFNYFGARGINKNFKAVRPLLTTNGQVTPSIEWNVDYEDVAPAIVATEIADSGANWDEVSWDEFDWAEFGNASQADWQSIGGVGYCGTPYMRAQVSQTSGLDVVLNVNGFDVVFEAGEFI